MWRPQRVGEAVIGNQEWHANREATFHGLHTGRGNARQKSGFAHTLWRDQDIDMLLLFQRHYPNARIELN